MENYKINSLLKEWIDVQKFRFSRLLSVMPAFRARIHKGSEVFYGNVIKSGNSLAIVADDETKVALFIQEKHVSGYQQEGEKGIYMNMRWGFPIILLFRTEEIRDQVWSSLLEILGNSGSSSSED